MSCTGVRATHRPTGVSVLITDERSQIKNKQRALEELEGVRAIMRAASEYIDWSSIKLVEPIEPLRGDEWRPYDPCIENEVLAFHEMIHEDIMAALTGERPLFPLSPIHKIDVVGRIEF